MVMAMAMATAMATATAELRKMEAILQLIG